MRHPNILNGGAAQNALATWKYAVATKVLVESTLSQKVVNNDTSFDFFSLKKKIGLMHIMKNIFLNFDW